MGEAREGGREVEGEAYTSDTLLMKPLTAKQRRKQQEQKKNPLKPSDKLKNMHDSSQTDAAKTHVMIKSTISRKRLHSCNTFCSLKTFIEVSFPTLKCTKHSFHLFYARFYMPLIPTCDSLNLRDNQGSLCSVIGAVLFLSAVSEGFCRPLSLSARSHVLSFLIRHPNIRSKMIGSPSSYLSLLKPST